MSTDDRRILIIQGSNYSLLDRVISFLGTLQVSYNHIYMFIAHMDSIGTSLEKISAREKPYYPIVEFFSSQTTHFITTSDRFYDYIHDIILPSDRLILHSVVLQSPGVWSFLGKLNPLEVIRKYLCDRHKRKKDKDYRNFAEETRLNLENELLKNKVLKQRIQIAKSIGMPDEQLNQLLNKLVYYPLMKLDEYQDNCMIEKVDMKPLEIEAKNTVQETDGKR